MNVFMVLFENKNLPGKSHSDDPTLYNSKSDPDSIFQQTLQEYILSSHVSITPIKLISILNIPIISPLITKIFK